MKKQLLKKIDHELSLLHEEDAEGHIWWMKFKEFVECIPDVSFPHFFVEDKSDDNYCMCGALREADCHIFSQAQADNLAQFGHS